MSILKKKNSFQSVFFPVILALFILSIIGFLIFSILRINRKRQGIHSQMLDVKEEVKTLKERNEELKKGILETEKETVLEREARERLNMKKPGERVVVVLPPEDKGEGGETKKEKNILEKLLQRLNLTE